MEIPDTTVLERDRRRRNASTTPYHIKELRDRHREMLRCKKVGMTNRDIAAQLGVSTASVSYTMASPLAKDKLAEMHAGDDEEAQDVSRFLQTKMQTCVELYANVVEGKIPASLTHKLKAAGELLDRGGVSKITQQNINHNGGYMDAEGLARIKARARELGLIPAAPVTEAGLVIEVAPIVPMVPAVEVGS